MIWFLSALAGLASFSVLSVIFGDDTDDPDEDQWDDDDAGDGDSDGYSRGDRMAA